MARTYVLIEGPVGGRKSAIAKRIEKAIRTARPDLRCEVFDHELFTFDEHYHTARDRVLLETVRRANDVSIIVSCTGLGKSPLKITVDLSGPGASIVCKAITDITGVELKQKPEPVCQYTNSRKPGAKTPGNPACP